MPSLRPLARCPRGAGAVSGAGIDRGPDVFAGHRALGGERRASPADRSRGENDPPVGGLRPRLPALALCAPLRPLHDRRAGRLRWALARVARGPRPGRGGTPVREPRRALGGGGWASLFAGTGAAARADWPGPAALLD